MKKYIFLLVLGIFAVTVNAQTIDSSTLAEIRKATMHLPRYQMYQTENIHTLLKLDTKTGVVTQVQYKMKDTPAMEVQINYFSITYDGWNGRFELYPTKNMYTFIMVDTYTGETYQVQWGTSSEYRFVEKLEKMMNKLW